ncbi:MAG: type II toxin-antitoxin system VapC family toxin [Polyangiaceae bacterium]|nr:type II toxin-antitoxin system VapC family toxin [Polyangiaceae bacterium]
MTRLTGCALASAPVSPKKRSSIPSPRGERECGRSSEPNVLDASIVIGWLLGEAEVARQAHAVRSRFESGEVALVPSLWALEVANSLVVNERRRRIDAETVEAGFRILRALPVRVASTSTRTVLDHVAVLARDQQLTSYDALYLRLAIQRNLPLATGDKKGLVRAAEALGVPLLLPA